jgi:hypothetical protein
MPSAKLKPLDPAVRDARKRALQERFERAEDQWAQAMRAHRLAPPGAGFAGRLRALGEASAAEAAVSREASELGLAWRPLPGAQSAEPPYELRPGTGRRGPSELWERFDTAVARFNRAAAGTDAGAVAEAHAELSDAAFELADAVDAEDRAAARAARRGTGAA